MYAGNEAPEVNIAFNGNKVFYFPGQPVAYRVSVTDKEDGKAMDSSNLVISADYREGHDKAGESQGHQVLTQEMQGKSLMESLDCKACHKVNESSVGPAFMAVAERYRGNAEAQDFLANKIIKGGGGVWGEAVMAAHPNLPQSDARLITKYILSLTDQKNQQSLPASGSLSPTLQKPVSPNGILYLTASYTDKGGQNIKPLTGTAYAFLRNNTFSAADITQVNNANKGKYGDLSYVMLSKDSSWLAIGNVDLTGVKNLVINLGWQDSLTGNNAFECYLDAPQGKKIGEYKIAGGKLNTVKTAAIPILPIDDGKLHTIYLVKKASGNSQQQAVAITQITFGNK